jgi:hypothetical protein
MGAILGPLHRTPNKCKAVLACIEVPGYLVLKKWAQMIPVKDVGFSEDGQSVMFGREGEENVRAMYPPNASSRMMEETGLSGAVWILRRER